MFFLTIFLNKKSTYATASRSRCTQRRRFCAKRATRGGKWSCSGSARLCSSRASGASMTRRCVYLLHYYIVLTYWYLYLHFRLVSASEQLCELNLACIAYIFCRFAVCNFSRMGLSFSAIKLFVYKIDCLFNWLSYFYRLTPLALTLQSARRQVPQQAAFFHFRHWDDFISKRCVRKTTFLFISCISFCRVDPLWGGGWLRYIRYSVLTRYCDCTVFITSCL